MARGDLTGKYFYSRNKSDWSDFTTTSGVRVLAVEGMDDIGDAVNIYTEQWIDSSVEDYVCTKKKQREINGTTIEVDDVVRKNVDINLTLIVSQRYAGVNNIDVQNTYDDIVSTICDNGDIYIWSTYTNKVAHVVCLKSFKPTAVKLHRGVDSYILATIPLHCIEPPEQKTS